MPSRPGPLRSRLSLQPHWRHLSPSDFLLRSRLCSSSTGRHWNFWFAPSAPAPNTSTFPSVMRACVNCSLPSRRPASPASSGGSNGDVGARPDGRDVPQGRCGDRFRARRCVAAGATDSFARAAWARTRSSCSVVARSGYWMTSSALSNSNCGIAMPSAFAALRLTTRVNRVGSSTGRSAGLAPRRILSTWAAMRGQDCPSGGP